MAFPSHLFPAGSKVEIHWKDAPACPLVAEVAPKPKGGTFPIYLKLPGSIQGVAAEHIAAIPIVPKEPGAVDYSAADDTFAD